jgi:hypothetical protein
MIDVWTKKSDMPKPRDCFSAATFNNKIYIFDGEIIAGDNWGTSCSRSIGI